MAMSRASSASTAATRIPCLLRARGRRRRGLRGCAAPVCALLVLLASRCSAAPLGHAFLAPGSAHFWHGDLGRARSPSSTGATLSCCSARRCCRPSRSPAPAVPSRSAAGATRLRSAGSPSGQLAARRLPPLCMLAQHDVADDARTPPPTVACAYPAVRDRGRWSIAAAAGRCWRAVGGCERPGVVVLRSCARRAGRRRRRARRRGRGYTAPWLLTAVDSRRLDWRTRRPPSSTTCILWYIERDVRDPQRPHAARRLPCPVRPAAAVRRGRGDGASSAVPRSTSWTIAMVALRRGSRCSPLYAILRRVDALPADRARAVRAVPRDQLLPDHEGRPEPRTARRRRPLQHLADAVQRPVRARVADRPPPRRARAAAAWRCCSLVAGLVRAQQPGVRHRRLRRDARRARCGAAAALVARARGSAAARRSACWRGRARRRCSTLVARRLAAGPVAWVLEFPRLYGVARLVLDRRCRRSGFHLVVYVTFVAAIAIAAVRVDDERARTALLTGDARVERRLRAASPAATSSAARTRST